MKHLRKFNEEYEIDTKDVNFFGYDRRDRLEAEDIARIHQDGKKLFVYNTDYELVEITNVRQLNKHRPSADTKQFIPCSELNVIMFLTKWQLEKIVKPMADNIFELKKAQEEAISIRLTQMKQIIIQKLV